MAIEPVDIVPSRIELALVEAVVKAFHHSNGTRRIIVDRGQSYRSSRFVVVAARSQRRCVGMLNLDESTSSTS
jgi:hypothetical protein